MSARSAAGRPGPDQKKTVASPSASSPSGRAGPARTRKPPATAAPAVTPRTGQARTAGAAPEQPGLGSAFFGATFAAVATSPPEISATAAAVRLQRCEMASGDVFGTDLFNAAPLSLTDALAPGPPALGRVGASSAFGPPLGPVLTAIFLIWVIERRDRAVLRMGLESLAAILVYVAGVAALFAIRARTDGG